MAMAAKYVRAAITDVLIAGAALAAQAQAPAPVAERVRLAMLARERGWELVDSAVEDRHFWLASQIYP